MVMKKWSRLQQVLWEIELPKPHRNVESHLDIGSGVKPRNPFKAQNLYACDILEEEKIEIECTYIQFDITKGLPFKSNNFASVSAYDVLEHVPRWNFQNGASTFPFVNLMNEIFRVLKPGGYFYSVTPMYPNIAAFSDPTHVNYISIETVSYFGNSSHANGLGYGFDGAFEIIFANWLRGSGPFDCGESLTNIIEVNKLSQESAKALARLVNRYLRRLINMKPTHGLWVLKKPDESC